MTSSEILQVRVHRGAAAHDVHADGELDIASTGELDAILSRAVGEASAVSLDLSGVFFCDVRGARLLADVAGAAEQAGVAFRVSGVRGEVARVLCLLEVELPA